MRNYIMGYILSLVLTLTAYFLVMDNLLAGWILVLIISALALIQFWIQLIFFLRLDQESKRGNLAILLSTVGIVFILVAGSLWIMNNLNYRHGFQETDQQILQNEAIPR